MRRTLSLFLALTLALFSSISFAEKYDFSNYTLDTLIEMRTELNAAIAELTVKNNSTLTPVASFEGEILFRNIPWGSNANVVLQKLIADGMANSKTDIDNDDYIYAWTIAESMNIASHSGANIALYAFPDGFNVAGYPLSQTQIYCPYGYTSSTVDRSVEGTKLMLVTMTLDVSDIDLVYSDLTNKLSSLYGTPEEIVDNNSYIVFSDSMSDYTQYNSWMVWTGANNTGVFLYKTYQIEKGSTIQKNQELMLVYGKTNGKEYLDGLDQAVNEEKRLQDALIQQQNSNNVDGL